MSGTINIQLRGAAAMFKHGSKQIYLICGANKDIRKGIDGLPSVVNVRFVSDVESYDSELLVLCNRKRVRSRSLNGTAMDSGCISNVLR